MKKLKLTDSFSQVNEILFANHHTETNNANVSCFVLGLRMEDMTKE